MIGVQKHPKTARKLQTKPIVIVINLKSSVYKTALDNWGA